MSHSLNKAIALIKKYETYRGTVYDDVGYPAIGYGHRIVPGELFVSLTEPEASALVDTDLRPRVQYIESIVKVPLNDGQFNALVDFVYNVGVGAFRDSTLLELLNQGKYVEASDQFLLWHHYTNAAGEKVDSEGLKLRREDERKLFLEGMAMADYDPNPKHLTIVRATPPCWQAVETLHFDANKMKADGSGPQGNGSMNAYGRGENADGSPAYGVKVQWSWPDGKDSKVFETRNREEIPGDKADGTLFAGCDFVISRDGYRPRQDDPGPYSMQILDPQYPSDVIRGMGAAPNHAHDNYRNLFRFVAKAPPIEPPVTPPMNDYVTEARLQEYCKDYMTRSEMILFLGKWKNDLGGE